MLYEGTTARVWNGDRISESFETGYGIEQGCNTIPLILDDLKDVLFDSAGLK